MPIVRPSRPGAAVEMTIAPEAGCISTAPTACSTRAPISIAPEVARPHSRLAIAKTVTPIMNARFFPMRSPIRPPRAINAARARRYAFTTQASWDSPSPRSRPICANATPTTVVSIMIMDNDPVIATRINARRRGDSAAISSSSGAGGSGSTVEDATRSSLSTGSGPIHPCNEPGPRS